MFATSTVRRSHKRRVRIPHGNILAFCLLLNICRLSPAQAIPSQNPLGSSQAHSTASRHQTTADNAREHTALQPIESMLQRGHTTEAKAALDAYLLQNPVSVSAYNLLGILESNQQDFDGALAAFHKALKLAPNSARPHVNLGNLYLMRKQADLADKEFRLALHIDPQDQEANYNLAVLLMAKGSFTQAIPYLQNIRTTNPAARFNLIRAYFETSQTDKALHLATTLSAENENSVQVHFSLGLLLASERQPKAAQAELLKADTLAPNTFEILLNLGSSLVQGNDPARAELTLSRALALKPDSAETLYWLGRATRDQARPLDALDYLIRARRLDPSNADILLLMAQISMAQNYFEDAIPLLQSALNLAPDKPDLHAALGKSYFMADKPELAIAEFKRWIEIEPSARSYAFLGIAYRSVGRFQEATENFKQGLKIEPDCNLCKFNLGFIAELRGDTATAEALFQSVLRKEPNYPDAIFELANIRIGEQKNSEAEQLLKKYVQSSPAPPNLAAGYYKLAIVERSLHETAASVRDLSVFQSLSKDASPSTHAGEHLFDYLDTRSNLSPVAREQLDLNEITEQVSKHPDQPQALYLLVSAYLKAGKVSQARTVLADLDKVSANNDRALIAAGVLLARYRLYDEAIQHFQAAAATNVGSNADEAYFNLADAYFRKDLYRQALDAAQKVSIPAQKQDANLSLTADIYMHLGDAGRAEKLYREAILSNPDSDQNYLSLALLQLRTKDIPGARQTLLQGQARVPASGKLVWGLALTSALEGKTPLAATLFERAVELLPEWSGSYSTLGFFYYETGQIDKAREVDDRFRINPTNGGLDLNRIEQALAQGTTPTQSADEPLATEKKQQLLQLALSLADKTL